jgi:hypothetical protein
MKQIKKMQRIPHFSRNKIMLVMIDLPEAPHSIAMFVRHRLPMNLDRSARRFA